MKSRVLLWGLLLLCALYLVQARSPLRLTNDSIVLLSIASSAADGHGFLDHGAKTHYPPGYPFMVVCLDELGAARPWGLVTLNALFLFMGLAATWYIARVHFQLSDQWSLVTSLLTASSFVLIKHFTLPLTDVPFFGLSLLSIALAVRAEKQTGRSFLIFWSLALLVATAGAFVRPVSIALYPALLWLLAERLARRRVMELNQKALTICCAVAAIVGSAATAILMRTKYVQEALSGYSRGGLLHTLAQILLFRVHEFGELVLNAPASKLGRLSFLVWILGVSAAIAAFTLLRRIRPSLVEVYLVAYAFILFLWPYEDTRFWTPVLPVICGECVAVMRPWNFAGWKKALGVSYAAVYLLLGFAAMAYSTEITFSGCDFPRRFGDGRLRSTYQAFYSQPTDLSTVDRQALELLERYARPASR